MRANFGLLIWISLWVVSSSKSLKSLTSPRLRENDDTGGIQCSPPKCDEGCRINYEAKPCPACDCPGGIPCTNPVCDPGCTIDNSTWPCPSCRCAPSIPCTDPVCDPGCTIDNTTWPCPSCRCALKSGVQCTSPVCYMGCQIDYETKPCPACKCLGFEKPLDCSEPRSEVCNSPYEVAQAPDSEAEFKSICRDVDEAFECWLNYEGKCEDDPSALGEIYRQKYVARKLCEDYSLFTPEIKDNFDCIKKNMFGGELCELGKDITSDLLYLSAVAVSIGYEIKPAENWENLYWCLKVSMVVSCKVVKTQVSCGPVNGLQNLVIKGYQMLHRDCSEDIEKYIYKFIKFMP